MSKFFSAAEIIQFAIKIEENGEEFYREAAKSAEEEKIKKIFIYLAGEEAGHAGIFQNMLSDVEEHEPPESRPGEYLDYVKAYVDGLVFTKAKKGKVMAGRMKTAGEALDFAIDVEIDSIHYYLEAENLIPESQRETVNKIIEEERRHYLKLLDIKKTL